MTFWQLLFIGVACVGCYSIGHRNGWNEGFAKMEAISERALKRFSEVVEKIGEAFEDPK